MAVYFANIAVFAAYSFLITYWMKPEKAKKWIVVLASLQFGFLMAFRDLSVGTDTRTYAALFMQVGASNDLFSVINSAPLYSLWCKLVYILWADPQAIVIANAVLVTVGIGVFIFRNTSNAAWSYLYYILFYFYFTSFNATRQYIALVLAINSYYYIRNKRLIPAVLLIAAATMVHNTAVVLAIALPLIYLKLDTRRWMLFGVLGGTVMLFSSQLLALFVQVFDRYSMYVDGSSPYSIGDVGQNRKIVITLLYLVIVLVAVYLLTYRRHLFSEEERSRLYQCSLILLVAVFIGFASTRSLLLSRVEMYFSVFVIVVVPDLLKAFGRWKYVIYFASFVSVGAAMTIQLLDNLSHVVPYRFFQR